MPCKDLGDEDAIVGQADFLVVADRLIDGTGRPPLRRSFVAVKRERIVAVGPVGEAEGRFPASIRRVDCPGCTILPGLVDSHVHLTFSAGPVPSSTSRPTVTPGFSCEARPTRGPPSRPA